MQALATGLDLWGAAKHKPGIVNTIGLGHAFAAVASTVMVMVRTSERSTGANAWVVVAWVLVLVGARGVWGVRAGVEARTGGGVCDGVKRVERVEKVRVRVGRTVVGRQRMWIRFE
ncbi:hypothetical protein AMAG_18335 [Allomyces macrogynus ATCC 38327]|uniref:Uncharacterized protein n=1 Tax=Allomyces macrogynus (strain ATCC 38327) TaxID=578462 RepID=A0A0L0S5A1_ALLM3|nr:hypothetical protein AMAG_18335 [Allomyces macrogynus ATCC 38327]|eukprot:KNE57635.1 hypothetical protein AMAG_18335 [Allomyces macrogynus ATCC 38327]